MTIKLLSICERTAKERAKAARWAQNEEEVLLLQTPAAVMAWRTTGWRRNRRAETMAKDQANATKSKHTRRYHNRAVVWDTQMTKSAGNEDWRKYAKVQAKE